MQTGHMYDILIAGGGPAGLTAALWLGRYLHRVAVIDSGDPRNWETRGINGFLGHPQIRPAELRGLGREECRRYGVDLIDGCIDRARKLADDCFALELESGDRVEGRRLLLAYGLRDIWPSVPGLEHCYGETAHVCPDCDGYEARDQRTVVIGSGRKAAGMALNLTTWTRQIVVCTNGAPPDMEAAHLAKLDALNIPVLTAPIVKLFRSPEATGTMCLDLEEDMTLDCERLFFSIGQHPADELGEQLGCARDEDGQIVVDEVMHTSVFNVFAAGDVTPGPQLAIRAAATGAVAALAIHKSLVPEERKL